MNGYVDTLKEQSTTVILGGCEVVISRAHLGLFLVLRQKLLEFESAPGSPELAKAVQDCFSLLGVDLSQANPVEILRAFYQVGILNRRQMTLPFQKNPNLEPEPKEAYDYPNRGEAWLISKLALHFGWSREEIFSLRVEEAFCYIQEILIAQHGEREFQYQLSEKSHQYDSTTKTSRYVPYQKPSWMLDYSLPAPVRVLRSMLPFGVVDLEGRIKEYHH